MGVFTLAMINVSAIVSLRGMPAESTYGLSSVFYYIFAAVFFLVPVSLVAAELTTGWPQKGGVYRWVGEAFGKKWGFLAIWLQWIESTIWFPTVLTFAAVSLAFMGPGQRWDEALAANKWYVLIVVLCVYWAATLLNLRGMKTSAGVTKWGTIIGTIIPGAILILLGLSYWAGGNPILLDMSWDKLIPDMSNFNNLVLAASIFLFYAGMEMSAVHVKDVNDPGRNYPLAILISAIITVLIFVLGTLAIGFIIPNSQINLVQSLLISYDSYFSFFGLGWMNWMLALALAVGVLAQVTAWVGGPSKGLYQVGLAGNLPPVMQKRKNGHPAHSGLHRHPAFHHVRDHAFRAVRLPDYFPAYHHPVPHHVHADVRLRHLSALPGTEYAPHFPHSRRQDPRHVDCGRPRLPGQPGGLPGELHPAEPNYRRQQYDVHHASGDRHLHLRRHSFHHPCHGQALLETACGS